MPMLGRQGQRNEPAYIRDVLDILDGALPDSTVNEIELITSNNVRRIFTQLQ
jgi:Tat protein secretion system quality control protein TatD with DNase activity